jgi:Uma2 family endonuclease
MSTARKPAPPTLADPFFYGFRTVERRLPNGRRVDEDIPLTEEDVIHPQEGDHISNNDPHAIDVRYLANVFIRLVAGTLGAVVLSDCLIHWRVGRIRPMSPDAAVIFGVSQRRPWSMFDVAAEGVAPQLVVEVTSPSTRNADLNRKPARYERVGVPFYAIVDQVSVRGGVRRLSIQGYRLGRRGFVRVRLNRQRRLWLPAVGCWLGADQGRVVCYDAQGQSIPDYDELAQALTAAQQQAQAEAQARSAAEERVRQLEEEIRRLRGDS